MNGKRFAAATLGGLAALTLVPAAASAAAEGTLTCTSATGSVAGFVAYVEVRSGNDIIARSPDRYADDIPDQEQADAGWYGFDLTFTLPPGNHPLKLWDVSFGDIDKHGVNPKGSPFGPANPVKCEVVPDATTTTAPVDPTVTIEQPTSTETPVDSSVLDATTVPATIPTIVVTNPPTVPEGPSTTSAPTFTPDELCPDEAFHLGCFPGQTTTPAPTVNTLAATGSNSTPMLAVGVTFLGLGLVAVLSARRMPGNTWS